MNWKAKHKKILLLVEISKKIKNKLSFIQKDLNYNDFNTGYDKLIFMLVNYDDNILEEINKIHDEIDALFFKCASSITNVYSLDYVKELERISQKIKTIQS